MHLKYKIITVITTLLLTVTIISSIINYRIDVRNTQRQLKNVSLPLSLDNIYTEIQDQMIKPLIVSSLMANNTFTRDWILSGETNIKPVSKYLKNIQDNYAVFTTYLVSDITKRYYHPKGLLEIIDINDSDDNWFFDFKNSNQRYDINLDTNDELGSTIIMFINYKIKDYNDKFIGATGIGIKLHDVKKMLNSFKENYRYDVYFVDPKGEILLYGAHLTKRGNISKIEGLKEIKSTIFKNKIDKFEYENDGKEYLLSVKYIEQLKLYLFVEISKDEYMRDINRNFIINLLVSIFITLLVLVTIIYTTNIYQKKLEKQAREDSLTGLANRRKFTEEFEYMFNLHRRGNIKRVSMVMIDIDDFKKINDTFGHLVGDKVLVRLSTILKNTLRKTDLITRWGGEEFAILIIDTKKERAAEVAEKLRVTIKQDKVLQEIIEKPLTVSLGLGELLSEDSEDGLIAKVDNALYKAKHLGKDRLVLA